MHYYLRCKACGEEYEGDAGYYQCPKCGGKLEVVYDPLPKAKNLSDLVDPSKPGLWKYWRLLPVSNVERALSLGEGDTFLHECNILAKAQGLSKIWIKDEGKNPTGSFKDRNAAVSVTKALEFGASKVAIASDANAGPAVAAYSAKAKLPCYVFMPSTTEPTRLAQAMVFGARVIRIEGEGLVNDCIDIVEGLRPALGWHHLTTAGPVNPYQLEAPKTVAYEIAASLKGVMPDWVAAPAGGGGLIAALFKGFEELLKLRLIDQMPRLLCVQTSACAPIVKAFREGREISRWDNPESTGAVPIAVPFPLEGEEVLRALKASNGAAVDVNDEEILSTQALLARTEGIFASLAGVSALAGTIKAHEQGALRSNDSVVVIVTGSGLKDLHQVKLTSEIPVLDASIENVKDFILGL